MTESKETARQRLRRRAEHALERRRLTEAETLLEGVLRRDLRHSGRQHPDTATTAAHLANVKRLITRKCEPGDFDDGIEKVGG